jgi:hypothetical protein
MRVFVSGATKTIRALVASPAYGSLARAHLGHLLTPANGNRIESLLETGLPIAIDNGAFAQFQAGASFDWRGYQSFVAMVARHYSAADGIFRSRLRFIVAPDAVGDWRKTARMWATWQFVCPPGASTLPWAYVGQDGQRSDTLPFAGDPRASRWTGKAALFIGGSDRWKCGSESARLVAAAKRAGRWVHVGRVNSMARLRRIEAMGADSFDGGQFSMFPSTYLPRYLERLAVRQEVLAL